MSDGQNSITGEALTHSPLLVAFRAGYEVHSLQHGSVHATQFVSMQYMTKRGPIVYLKLLQHTITTISIPKSFR